MKSFFLSIIVSILYLSICNAQRLVNAYSKAGKVYAQFDNGNTKLISATGENSVVAFSRNKNFVIFQRVEQKSKTGEQEGEESYDQCSIRLFNLTTNQESTMFTTCLDGNGGTKPDYANSSIYPNANLCGFESPSLTDDGERLYFETAGWTTCHAIHYYNIKEKKLVFCMAGWLKKVQKDGVVVEITDIEFENKHGNLESKGRYVQTCLFDFNGNLIRELTGKEF